MKYRKKPVVVEAAQFHTGIGGSRPQPDTPGGDRK